MSRIFSVSTDVTQTATDFSIGDLASSRCGDECREQTAALRRGTQTHCRLSRNYSSVPVSNNCIPVHTTVSGRSRETKPCHRRSIAQRRLDTYVTISSFRNCVCGSWSGKSSADCRSRVCLRDKVIAACNVTVAASEGNFSRHRQNWFKC